MFIEIYIGASGLYCGILLAEAGHTVTIFEANNQAGGRIQTYRDPKDPLKYTADLGAARFPLPAHAFLNHLLRERYKLELSDYPVSDENAYTYVNGILVTNKEASENPDIFQFNLNENEQGKVKQEISLMNMWVT